MTGNGLQAWVKTSVVSQPTEQRQGPRLDAVGIMSVAAIPTRKAFIDLNNGQFVGCR
jgi:hypothetical protein